jgi:peptidoglycan/LPS O-acetylase OafA/YrhL
MPAWLLKALAFVGTVSLELYLIHVNFVLKYLRPYDLGYWLTLLLMTAISLLLAWLIHKIMKRII